MLNRNEEKMDMKEKVKLYTTGNSPSNIQKLKRVEELATSDNAVVLLKAENMAPSNTLLSKVS
jgi:hypothetical protein